METCHKMLKGLKLIYHNPRTQPIHRPVLLKSICLDLNIPQNQGM